MRAGSSALLLTAFALAGCDRITGADQQKIFDAEAVGYACRISIKTPEDCMKENEAMSPTSILAGWKAANKDIDGQIIDPSMGKQAAKAVELPGQPVVAETAGKAAAGKTAEKVAGKTAEQPKNEKPIAAKPEAAKNPKVTGH